MVAVLAPGTAHSHYLPRAIRELGLQGLRVRQNRRIRLLIKVEAIAHQTKGKEAPAEQIVIGQAALHVKTSARGTKAQVLYHGTVLIKDTCCNAGQGNYKSHGKDKET